MKFGGFKIGKSSEEKGKDKALPGGGAATQIAELEVQLNDRMDNLKQTQAKLKKLSGKKTNGKDLDDSLVMNHGPIEELSVEPGGELQDLVLPEISEADDIVEDSAEPVKLVEVKIKPDAGAASGKVPKVEPVASPPAAKAVKAEPAARPAAKETKAEAAMPPAPEKSNKDTLSKDSLSSLFAQDEEEENPLAGLMRSLPEVDTHELLEDIKEIKGIIEDWQKK
ncbi:MAG: hypothetical protein ABR886_06535 [Dehalococcoidales bacterium]|jgi:hypothetical protein